MVEMSKEENAPVAGRGRELARRSVRALRFGALLLAACGGEGPAEGSRTDAAPAADQGRPAAEAGPTAPDAGPPPSPDAGPPPSPDAGPPPSPDAGPPPSPDAAVVPSPDAAVVPSPDAGPPPSPDAAVVPSPDAGPPPSPDAAVVPSPDAAPPPPVDLAPERDCAVFTPVLALGVFYQPLPAGLDGTPRVSEGPEPPAPRRLVDFSPEEHPAGTAGRTAAAPGAATVFQVLRSNAGCRLLGVDLDAGPVWVVEAPEALSCAAPAASDAGVLWPVTTAAGGALWLLDAETGARAAALDLPVDPTTGPVFIGDGPDPRENGGSHWLVGGENAVMAMRVPTGAAPPVLEAVEALDGVVTALAAAASGRQGADAVDAAVATLRSDPETEGYGDVLARFDVDVAVGADALLAARPVVDLGAPARTPPVLALDCAEPGEPVDPVNPQANGGSHWWCPGGLVAVGQDGMLRAFEFETGALYREIALNPGLRPTGLTLGRDDRFYNGGSHWRGGAGGFFALNATDPVAGHPATLAAGIAPEATCVPAPVLDSDGALRSARIDPAGGVHALASPSDSGGAGVGYSRPGGDASGSARPTPADAPCPGGPVPLFSAATASLAGLEVFAAVGLPDGGRVIAAEEIDRPGLTPTLVRVGASGRPVWRRTFPDAQGRTLRFSELAVDPVGGRIFAVGGTFSLALGLEGPTVVRVDLDGGAPRSATIDDGTRLAGSGLVPEVDGGVSFFGLSVNTGDVDRLRLDATLTEVGRVRFAPLRNRPVQAAIGQGADVLVLTEDGVTRFSPAGDVLAEFRPPPPGAPATRLRAHFAVSPAGEVFVAATLHDGAGRFGTAVEVLSSALSLVGEQPVAGIERPQGLGLTPEGAAGWLLSSDLRLVRLSAAGAASPAVPVPVGAGRTVSVGLSLDPDGRPQVLANALLADLQTRAPLLAQADFDGRAACGAAGRCVGADDGPCVDPNPCLAGRCVPSTGECAFEPLPDGAPCGAARTCRAGLCE